MNFLAHLTLSHFDVDLQTGNFLGDFVKGSDVARLPAGVRRGVAMHRAIDHLTDYDPEVRALNRLIRPRHGRYAGVVTDIAFDHYLYRNWARFGPLEFDAFRVATYWGLHARTGAMPPRVRGYVDGMVRHDWLRLYTTPQGMRQVFGRLRPRLSRPTLLDGVDRLLTDYDAAFNQTFLHLFPRLQTLADAYRTTAPDP